MSIPIGIYDGKPPPEDIPFRTGEESPASSCSALGCDNLAERFVNTLNIKLDGGFAMVEVRAVPYTSCGNRADGEVRFCAECWLKSIQL